MIPPYSSSRPSAPQGEPGPHSEGEDLIQRLPESLVVVRVLARRPGEVVVQARLDGRLVAVRAMAEAESSALAEWSALQGIASEAVASIEGWGLLEASGLPASGRGLWVARQWIEGESLEVFARQATDAQIAAAAADVFAALEEIHRAGIVHGDLSPGNIIVGPDGRAFLTDFGLASSVAPGPNAPGAAVRRSGTPLFIAPEVLIGAAPTAVSDYFGAAAVLALALAKVQVDPAHFYGRFPGEPFLASAGIELESLPSWSRSLLTSLLARDPDERRAASHLAPWKALVDAPGGDKSDASRVSAARLRPLSFLANRDHWVSALETAPAGLVLASASVDVECRHVLDAAAVRWLRAGREVHLVDLRGLAQRARTTLELDRLIASEVEHLSGRSEKAQGAGDDHDAPPGLLLVPVAEDDEWSLEALDMLGHATLAQGGILTLILTSELRMGRVARRRSPWSNALRHPLPALTRKALIEEMRVRLRPGADHESEGWNVFVDRLDQVARGSVARVNDLLASAAEQGAFELESVPSKVDASGSAQLILRSTFVPDQLVEGHSAEELRGLAKLDRTVLAALLMLGGEAPQHRLASVAGEAADVATLRRLSERGLVVPSQEGQLRFTGTLAALGELQLSRADFEELHASVLRALLGAAHLDSLDELDPDHWVHALGAASGPRDPLVRRVEDSVEELDRKGLTTRVARGLQKARTFLESEKRAMPASLMAHLARALARCSDASAARRVAELSGSGAIIHEVEGVLEHLDGKLEASAASFRLAGRPLQAAVEEAHAALERSDLDAFDRAWATAGQCDKAAERAGEARWVEMLSLAAVAAERRGDTALAWSRMDEALEGATAERAPLSEAAIRMNRASLARRTGDADRARAELDEARALYQSTGSAAGEAHSQGMLGTLLKDQDRWLEAEQPLLSALRRRERLGHHAQAEMTRGTLGLVLLERGHLRRALDLLEQARQGLAQAKLLGALALIRAALDLARARVGLEREGAPVHDEGDARIALWTDRARRLREGSGPVPDDLTRMLEPSVHGTAEEQVAEWLERARAQVESGRDSLAARLAIEATVLAEAQGLDELARAARQMARSRLARVQQGLTDQEASRAEETLLGVPDPAPDSLERWRARQDDEMDVMRILELNERLVRQEDTSRLLGAIVEAAIEISGAERGFIVMSKDGALELDTAFDSSRGEVEDEDVEFSRSIVEEALETRRSLRVSDAVEHEEWAAARSVEDLHLRSILVAPFFVSPRVAGVVVVDDRTRPGAFGSREQRLLEMLSGQAALAIRQVHRLEENRSLAAELRRRVVTQGAQLEEATRALDRASVAAPIEGLIGDSQAMDAVRSMIHRVSRSDIATLITGPSGSGKEVAARALHSLSLREGRPFVAENCAALPPSLAESELFGVKKGAFTGADVDRPGLFERAEGGTLFLDEIGELPAELQAKLLRVLETRRVRRVGETVERAVDFRLVSATNRDLSTEVDAGRFRADLMYRLDGVTIEMPPLGARTEDIPALVRHFLAMEAREGQPPRTMDGEVLRRLMERPWPGNVRELSNEVSRLCVLSGPVISDLDLVRVPAAKGAGEGQPGAAGDRRIRPIAELERIAILDALAETGDDKREAAKLLGISRAKIYQRLKEWGEE